MMNNEKVTPAAVQSDHWRQTRAQMAQAQATVVVVGDTSTFSYQRQDLIEGLGPVGDNKATSQGFLMHTMMALELMEETAPSNNTSRHPARILGLVHQQFHVRARETEEQKQAKTARNKKNGQGRSRGKGVEGNPPLESDLWMEPLKDMEPPPEGRRYIITCDREADIYEMLIECRHKEYDFCIRASRNRAVVEEEEKLFDQARQQPSLGTTELQLRARPESPARTATLSVSVLRDVVIRSPQRPGHAAGKLPGVELSVVRVWEENPPAGQEEIEWLLLLSASPETFEEVLFWVRVYALRWVIEEYHKCVKTGMGAEELQLESGKGLTTAVSIMAVVALRLLAIRDMARLSPQEPARVCGLAEDELEVLSGAVKRTLKTVRDVVLALGHLGGHPNRKSDGLPGWMTLWHGMFKLQNQVAGYRYARSSSRRH